jgi:hypothetical protein
LLIIDEDEVGSMRRNTNGDARVNDQELIIIDDALITTWQVDGGNVALICLSVDPKSVEARHPKIMEDLSHRFLETQRDCTNSL